MKIIQKIINLLLFCLIGACVTAPTLPEPPKAEVIQASKSNEIIWITPSNVKLPDDKIILVFVGGGEFCHWCESTQENFKDPEITALVNKYFYPIYIDVRKDPEMARIFDPSMEIPALVFFTTQDIFILPGFPPAIDAISAIGYLSKDQLLALLLDLAKYYHGENASFNQP